MGNASPLSISSLDWFSGLVKHLSPPIAILLFTHRNLDVDLFVSPETPCSGGVLFPRLPVRPQSQHRNKQARRVTPLGEWRSKMTRPHHCRLRYIHKILPSLTKRTENSKDRYGKVGHRHSSSCRNLESSTLWRKSKQLSKTDAFAKF